MWRCQLLQRRLTDDVDVVDIVVAVNCSVAASVDVAVNQGVVSAMVRLDKKATRLYVLDTNVLIHDPTALYHFDRPLVGILDQHHSDGILEFCAVGYFGLFYALLVQFMALRTMDAFLRLLGVSDTSARSPAATSGSG